MGRHSLGLSPTISQIRPWHRAIARSVVAGLQPHELCALHSMTPGHISRILGSPLFKAEVARLEAQAEADVVNIHSDLQVMSSRAVEIIDREMEDDPTELDERRHQASVAFNVLDKSGYTKKDRPIHLHKHAHVHTEGMTDEELFRDVIDIVGEDVDA